MAAGPDRALDGIAFPSEAWDTRGVSGLPSPGDRGEAACPARVVRPRKLFAFGHDAWLITAYLERLATRADGSVQGATGTLRLDGFGNVRAHAGMVDLQRRHRGAAGNAPR